MQDFYLGKVLVSADVQKFFFEMIRVVTILLSLTVSN